MPTIRIDNEVYAWLQSQARPFEDTPNSVLRRIAGLDNENKTNFKKRTKKYSNQEKTPQYAYRKPILTILRNHGGKAHRATVLEELEKMMNNQFTEYDKTDIASGTIRWQKTAEWEVRVMREQNLLKPVSETPRGVWALTEKSFENEAIL